MSKSKRIKDAAKELERALRKHVDVVTDSAVSMKKAQRAGARLASAAQVYAEAVGAKTGLDNPFLTGGGKLDDEATRSLLAERDGIAKSLTGQIPALPDLPTEIDLSPAEFHALETSALEASGSPDASVVDAPLDDAVEDWADDSIEVDEDEEPSGVGAEPDEDEPSIADAPVVAAEPVEQWVGDRAPASDDLGGADLFADIVAVTSESPEPASAAPVWNAQPEQSEPPVSQPRHAQSEAGREEPEHIESVWSGGPEGSETSDSGEEPPALPEQEPSSEEDKPYSEDI